MKKARRAWPISPGIVCVTLASLCGTSAPQLVAAPAPPRANVTLSRIAATLTQTSDTQWTLTKTGSTGGATVSWSIEATQGPTMPGILTYDGTFTVENKGTAGATLGNIVVNLQTKQGKSWVTRSSVIADATQDDAATHANISPLGSSEGRSSFDESSASGHLLLTDASTRSTFALAPQITLAPGSTTALLFTATFDNAVLDLAAGTPTRAEIIASFGNARANLKSSPNVDINGNGIIDPDEASVQSVSGRPTASVPAATPANLTVTLSDSPSDITTTGTVTFSNPRIALDQAAQTGTVIVDFDAGASGGTITNCAHLTGAVDLTACDTQVIGPRGCVPGRPGCGWANGDMLGYDQSHWGDDPATAPAAANLAANFGVVYPFSVVEVGISGLAGFSNLFSSADAILNYLPQGGTPGPLTQDLLNPTSSAAGAFGGVVPAMRLDIDFSDAGVLPNASGQRFGDLRLCNLFQTSLNGMTMRELMTLLDTALGGGSTGGLTYDELYFVGESASGAFTGGAPSLFAQQHIFSGPVCPCTPGTPGCGWADGDMVSWGQSDWGDDPAANPAAARLASSFGGVYPFSAVEIGISGATGFSLGFTSAASILNYLPQGGSPGPLTEDLLDPADSPAGAFGGAILAMRLDIDFVDRGFLSNDSGLRFGDLRVCNLPQTTLNGMTMRELLAFLDTALGGGGTGGYTYDELYAVAENVSGAFTGALVTPFAQQHIVSGPSCN